jgi:exopolysaccharide biosynthesis polyprenyl glycosylphosphotransferase
MTSHEITSMLRRPDVTSFVVPGRWESAYHRTLIMMDASVGLLAAVVAYIGASGPDRAAWDDQVYLIVTLVTPAAWVTVLALMGGYHLRHLSDGRDDSRRVILAGTVLIGVVAWLTWATPVQVPRDYVLMLVGVGGGLTLAGRQWQRHALRVRRRRGECVQRVLAVGQRRAVSGLAQRLAKERNHGAVLVGCCLPEVGREFADAESAGLPDRLVADGHVPVLGDLQDVPSVVERVGADTVAVLPCTELEDHALRRLAWALEGRAQHFVVVPGLSEVAFPRLTVQPVGGLPVLHVRHPRLSGAAWVVKAILDRVLALVALLILSPLMLIIGAVVRLTTPGPAIFRQKRVGAHGQEFTFLKFRTMHADAEQCRDELAMLNINSDGLLFKVRQDPRVTPIGAVLRRWSLDELPQLLNVLVGHMSLVGPRPPLPEEVARYGDEARRRLLVRPGLTGLWQVSGRSDLAWEEAVRLDLHYVDNWSLTLDIAILWRTLSAVLHGTGAY